jgi:hypothetical protein
MWRDEIEITQTKRNEQKPPDGRPLQPRQECEQHNAGDTTRNVQGVGFDSIRLTIQSPTKLLTWPNESEGNYEKEKAAKDFDGNCIAR